MEAVKNLLRDLGQHEETVLDVIRDMTTDAQGNTIPRMRLEVVRRDVQPEDPRPPIRAESPRRCHTFNNLDGFRAYLKRYGNDDTVVLADFRAQVISAVLDERAGQGFEIIRFEPQIHPLLAPWLAVIGKAVSLADLVQHLLTWRRTIVEPDSRELVLTLSQVRASTKITLHSGRGTKCINGLVMETEIQGQRQTDTVDIPESIRLNCPIYVSMSNVDIEVDLTLSATEGGTRIAALLTSAELELEKVRAFEEIVSALQADAGGRVVGFGRPNHAAWDYLAAECDDGE